MVPKVSRCRDSQKPCVFVARLAKREEEGSGRGGELPIYARVAATLAKCVWGTGSSVWAPGFGYLGNLWISGVFDVPPQFGSTLLPPSLSWHLDQEIYSSTTSQQPYPPSVAWAAAPPPKTCRTTQMLSTTGTLASTLAVL